MTFLERARSLARAWSVQLAALGAAVSVLFSLDPVALQAGWATMPAEIRAMIPDHVASWITALLFVAVIVARAAPQAEVADPAPRSLLRPAAGSTEPGWRKAVRASCARSITSIAVHSSATPEGRVVTAETVRGWHKRQGWSDIGYHFFVRLDGTIEVGRPIGQSGAHVLGHNANSVGICYAGGVDATDRRPKDTRTAAQKLAMVELLQQLKLRWPAAEIRGHRDYRGAATACPSFDARAEYAGL